VAWVEGEWEISGADVMDVDGVGGVEGADVVRLVGGVDKFSGPGERGDS
jgi:hypothetical protein